MQSGAREWGPLLSSGSEEALHRFATQVWKSVAPTLRANWSA
jgi:hypothetical protein